MWTNPIPSLEQLQDAIYDATYPIGMRMRAAYYLRQMYLNSITIEEKENNKTANDSEENTQKEETKSSSLLLSSSSSSSSGQNKNNNKMNQKGHPANEQEEEEQRKVIELLSHGLLDKTHGSLMRHEFAYVMGQLNDERCCPTLETVLLDTKDCSMVRHEAAEALGAIGAIRSKPILWNLLEQNEKDKETTTTTTTTTTTPPEVLETCRLAINLMDWRTLDEQERERQPQPVVCSCMINPYSSIDPAPASPEHDTKTTEELGNILCCCSSSEEVSLFERYRAMFSLRNRGGKQAVLQLGRALISDETSALLRHEVAYVLGQMQHVASIDALEQSLRRTYEHPMVRHESAEALGAIDCSSSSSSSSSRQDWERIESILQEFSNDPNPIVRESCLVALDAAEYWGHNNNHNTSSSHPNLNENNNNDEDGGDENNKSHDNKKQQQVDGNNEQEQKKKVVEIPVISFGQHKALSSLS